MLKHRVHRAREILEAKWSTKKALFREANPIGVMIRIVNPSGKAVSFKSKWRGKEREKDTLPLWLAWKAIPPEKLKHAARKLMTQTEVSFQINGAKLRELQGYLRKSPDKEVKAEAKKLEQAFDILKGTSGYRIIFTYKRLTTVKKFEEFVNTHGMMPGQQLSMQLQPSAPAAVKPSPQPRPPTVVQSHAPVPDPDDGPGFHSPFGPHKVSVTVFLNKKAVRGFIRRDVSGLEQGLNSLLPKLTEPLMELLFRTLSKRGVRNEATRRLYGILSAARNIKRREGGKGELHFVFEYSPRTNAPGIRNSPVVRTSYATKTYYENRVKEV